MLIVGLSEFHFRQVRAQIIWEPIDTSEVEPSPVMWESITGDGAL